MTFLGNRDFGKMSQQIFFRAGKKDDILGEPKLQENVTKGIFQSWKKDDLFWEPKLWENVTTDLFQSWKKR